MEILITFIIMKFLSHKNYFILPLLLIGFITYGQGPPPPPPTGEDVLPIDGGVFILLAISILFGLYKLYQYQQQKKIPA